MTALNIDKRTVVKTLRNGRFITNTSTASVSAGAGTGNNTGTVYEFTNGLNLTGSTVSMSGKYTGYTENFGTMSLSGGTVETISGTTSFTGFTSGYTGNTLSVYGNVFIDGELKVSKEVFAYFASGTSENVLNDLSTTAPLAKDSGNTITLNYSSQFEVIDNALSIKASVLTGSTGGGGITGVTWSDVTDKPLVFTPDSHTIGSHSDSSSYFTGTKALTASVADSANACAWSNVSGKPTYFTPDSHTQDWTTITGKPTTFTPTAHTQDWSTVTGKPSTFTPSSHTIGSHSDSSSYFTGTAAVNALALGGTAASAFYNSTNFNKTTVAMSCSTLTAATSVVVNGWTISVSSGAIYFNNGSNRCKVDASGNLTCTGEITAFGSV